MKLKKKTTTVGARGPVGVDGIEYGLEYERLRQEAGRAIIAYLYSDDKANLERVLEIDRHVSRRGNLRAVDTTAPIDPARDHPSAGLE